MSALEQALLEDGYEPHEVEAELRSSTLEGRAEKAVAALERRLAGGPAPGEAERALRELVALDGRLPPRLRDAPAPPLKHAVPNGAVEARVALMLARLRGRDLADLPAAQRLACERMAALLVLALNEVAWELADAERAARVEAKVGNEWGNGSSPRAASGQVR